NEPSSHWSSSRLPNSEEPRSAFFLMARLEPRELANFLVSNIALGDRDNVVEVVGPAMAIWWPSHPRAELDDLADAARAWFRTICSAYYLVSGLGARAFRCGMG